MLVGDFLREKATNMARWVAEGVGKENLPVDLVALVSSSRNVELVYFAQLLDTNRRVLIHSDWIGLQKVIEAETAPVWVATLINAVRQRNTMHDKFWRYMQLFADTVRSSDDENDGLNGLR